MSAREWVIILGMTAVTFGVRYPVMALVSRRTLSPALLNAMRYIPPAVLTAIIVPAVLMPDGEHISFHYSNSYLVAGVVAALVAWRTRNLLLTIAIGLAFFAFWRLVVV